MSHAQNACNTDTVLYFVNKPVFECESLCHDLNFLALVCNIVLDLVARVLSHFGFLPSLDCFVGLVVKASVLRVEDPRL